MPQTESEFEHMRDVLLTYFGIEDAPDVWITVYGQLVSTPIASKRFTYAKLATAGHRLRINKFINDKKLVELEKLQAKLTEAIERANTDGPVVPEGSHDIPGELHSVPNASEGMVFDASGDGIY